MTFVESDKHLLLISPVKPKAFVEVEHTQVRHFQRLNIHHKVLYSACSFLCSKTYEKLPLAFINSQLAN